MSDEKEYDNRNQGALIQPYDSMEFMLQGDLNVDGVDFKAAIIADTLRDGRTILHVYQRVGAMFKGRSETEGAPNYTGNIFDDKNLFAWKNISKKGNPYLKVSIGARQQKEETQNNEQPNDMDDEIQF